MLFLSVEDFYEKVKAVPRLTRDEEKACAERMNDGDAEARSRIIEGYLPLVAAIIKRYRTAQNLSAVYACIRTLEGAVDRFDFANDGDTFTHYLSIRMKSCIVGCSVQCESGK